MTQKIIDRIINKIKIPDFMELMVDRLSFQELQSLLLKILELKIKKKNLKDLFREYQLNRFVRPSDINPVLHRKIELSIFSLLPSGFETIDLSHLTPLGTSSVLTTIHQNNIVSTIRNLEVAADTTNILALEGSNRRLELLKKDKKNAEKIKLCSSQRLTRGQSFENKAFSAHFNVIALITAGRDEGHDSFEIMNLQEHVLFYIDILEQIIDSGEIKKIIVKFYSYEGSDNYKLIEHIKTKLSERSQINIETEENSEFGRNYYSRLRFVISLINRDDKKFDYIDGGFTDWTSKILNNKKERLLTSGIGTDFLLRTVKLKSLTNNA